ncbi:hypothetical protein DPMN_080395 [Dreissena polymorpha]|uniref:Uncharacterized protein n=1 Tax=Dreissena polymorpha TaxID=45954 RepID=A0A9D3YVJ4_DREPO|nr:hypothetical protein DPMN_080395 [Dreissena polymorpha]
MDGQLDSWFDGPLDACIDRLLEIPVGLFRRLFGWTFGRQIGLTLFTYMDGCLEGWLYELLNVFMVGLLEGCLDGLCNDWLDGLLDGCIERVILFTNALINGWLFSHKDAYKYSWMFRLLRDRETCYTH